MLATFTIGDRLGHLSSRGKWGGKKVQPKKKGVSRPTVGGKKEGGTNQNKNYT